MHSSRWSSIPSTSTTSPAKCPPAHAAAARWCEPAAKASCSSREMAYLSASSSAPSPSATVHAAGIRGLTIRHPSAEFHSCSWPVG